jgi:hypothetical protein
LANYKHEFNYLYYFVKDNCISIGLKLAKFKCGNSGENENKIIPSNWQTAK